MDPSMPRPPALQLRLPLDTPSSASSTPTSALLPPFHIASPSSSSSSSSSSGLSPSSSTEKTRAFPFLRSLSVASSSSAEQDQSLLAVPADEKHKGKRRRALFPFQLSLSSIRLSPKSSPCPSPLPSPSSLSPTPTPSLLSLPPPTSSPAPSPSSQPTSRTNSRLDLSTPSPTSSLARPTRTRNVNQPFPRYRTPRPSPSRSPRPTVVDFTREQLDALIGAPRPRAPSPHRRTGERDVECTYYCRALPYEAGYAPGVYVEYEGKARGLEADLGLHRVSLDTAGSDEWDEDEAGYGTFREEVGRGRPPGYHETESRRSSPSPSSSASTVMHEQTRGCRRRHFSLTRVLALRVTRKSDGRSGTSASRLR
ncbi:hypothetical protein OE88DRAFT_1803820 [Heliocybe sulcata]|uniref:Uncharacterized protein n=1 Tax=Heliocybe sulcata TaxID=5364 RepID=A0A5C3NM49_9AGAM|nr:hypothetical protein OE88DRAFT_1803820 [Heliocybe sulcata]